jgi:bifunctional UDP-N-acetylglucosamine pyrophosphorylase/glucosamine-1-phosphate N-acetyltransferase
MLSAKPKVLMDVLFEPMLGWVLNNVREAGIEDGDVGVVVGSKSEQVTAYLAKQAENGAYRVYVQQERLGTAHAAMQAADIFDSPDDSNGENEGENNGDVAILCGDAPFMDAKTIADAYEFHKENGNDVTVITARIADPANYGRIKRDSDGALIGIIEKKDCTPDELRINEINSGAYWFKKSALRSILPQIGNDNNSGEYYLTDAVALAAKKGAFTSENPLVAMGANNRKELRLLNDEMTRLINDRHYDAGVDIIGYNVIIGRDVTIGQDTVIMPNTIITGETRIGANCRIGPGSRITDCKIGDNVTLNNVQAVGSVIASDVTAGPYVNIRPGTVLESGVKIGDFVEIKNSTIGAKTAMAHLTYVADSDVGRGVNFGCGCVTANYDGINKYRTIIGDNAFIGCNTNLIAPVTVGNNATTGAGSTIDKDVPDDALALERAGLIIKENWKKNKERPKKG